MPMMNMMTGTMNDGMNNMDTDGNMGYGGDCMHNLGGRIMVVQQIILNVKTTHLVNMHTTKAPALTHMQQTHC